MNAKCLLSALVTASVIGSAGIKASENETMFLPSVGKLVIPHLILNNEIYYVELNRTPIPGYNFNLDGASVLKITPKPGDDWASAAEVVGNWKPLELPGITLSFAANGTYSMFNPVEEDCPAGTETGTWTIDDTTGIFLVRGLTDANSHCGLSPPDGPVRIKRVGANLMVTLTEFENGQQMSFDITLVPN